MRVYGGKEVVHLDCRIGVGHLCQDYHNKTFYAKNMKILAVNDKVHTLIRGDFKLEDSKNITIDHSNNLSGLIEDSAESARIYPKFFCLAFLITLVLVSIIFIIKISLLKGKDK